MYKALILLTFVLSGCQPPSTPPQQSASNLVVNHTAYVWTDPDTDCQYLSNGLSSAFTPRLSSNGQHLCRPQ
jgi:hypothetical protein